MATDSERWDQKYRSRKHEELPDPDLLLIESAALFGPEDIAIDLACGTGRHAIYLASLGCHAVAIDCSHQALKQCAAHASARGLPVQLVAANLNDFRLAPSSVNAIVCFHYLNRGICGNLIDALKPNGVLIFKTFNQNFLRVKANFNPDYVLAPGELRRLFATLQPLNGSDDCQADADTKSFLVAHKTC